MRISCCVYCISFALHDKSALCLADKFWPSPRSAGSGQAYRRRLNIINRNIIVGIVGKNKKKIRHSSFAYYMSYIIHFEPAQFLCGALKTLPINGRANHRTSSDSCFLTSVPSASSGQALSVVEGSDATVKAFLCTFGTPSLPMQ